MRWARNSDGRKTDAALRELLANPISEQDPHVHELYEVGCQWRDTYAALVHKQSPIVAYAWLGLQEEVPSPRRVVAMWDEWMRDARLATQSGMNKR